MPMTTEVREAIRGYEARLPTSPGYAAAFILGQFRGPASHEMRKAYLPLVMCADGDTHALNPLNHRFYELADPPNDFRIGKGEFILFSRGPRIGPIPSLLLDGKRPFIRRVEVVGGPKDGSILDAHVYDPDHDISRVLRDMFGDAVDYAGQLMRLGRSSRLEH